MKLIIAVNKKGYIGKDNKMLWHSKDDFKHFKKMTMGSILIVGRKTFEECMGGEQLPRRCVTVVGTGSYRDEHPDGEGPVLGEPYLNLYQAMQVAVVNGYDEELSPYSDVWVIGGKQIYDHFVHFCDEIHMSLINDDQDGDVKWEVPSNYKGKVFYYEFEPTKPNERPREHSEVSPSC